MPNYNAIFKKAGLFLSLFLFTLLSLSKGYGQETRTVADFDKDWYFHLGDMPGAENAGFSDADWRLLNLPHDWSIEGKFSKDNPATPEGGALPGGVGWYRTTFRVPAGSKDKLVYIDFDGVYQKSDVWINGHHLGFRPNGYISFRYELTPYLNYKGLNTIAVRVDNSVQPNSRWYSGSGIYRNVWLVTTNKTAINHWGTYITTPEVSNSLAGVQIQTSISNNGAEKTELKTTIYDEAGKQVASIASPVANGMAVVQQSLHVTAPKLWSVERPYLYKAVSQVLAGNKINDTYTTTFGIRYFNFDVDKGFSLNGKPLKILGVCDHHDLGSLGAAVNTRALERQLQMLKAMGCNGIRTSHNPPAPELLDLCDKWVLL